ncbi:MAG: MmcQ protein [Eubacterium sp.]|jgi:predicted DNA-binding protein (MmcQ/YjbR family)|nr:MmcQ protein [Eubacterium sp.]
MRKKISDFIKKKYKVSPEYPWQKYDSNAVFRHSDNNKWFALVMCVQRCKLGLSGEDHVDVINLKVDDIFFRDTIIQEDGIMPAYHMNKQHWISVLLDGTVAKDRIFDLIHMSFLATASTKQKEKIRPPKEWIIPANPKFYDVEHAFDKSDEVNWKQGRGIKAGDTVFMYVAAPVSAILYQCKVIETNVPYEYKDENLVICALMKLKLLKRFRPDQFTFQVLKEEYEVSAVRGPKGIPDSLSATLSRVEDGKKIQKPEWMENR